MYELWHVSQEPGISGSFLVAWYGDAQKAALDDNLPILHKGVTAQGSHGQCPSRSELPIAHAPSQSIAISRAAAGGIQVLDTTNRSGNACESLTLMYAEVEKEMAEKVPSDEAQGKKNQLIGKLHQQFDPAEKIPVDPKNLGPKRSQKQPGQALRDPQEDTDDGE
jgi:hypothetical protein